MSYHVVATVSSSLLRLVLNFGTDLRTHLSSRALEGIIRKGGGKGELCEDLRC